MIMIPSLVYISVYYGVYMYFLNRVENFDILVFQTPFRIGVSLILLSLLIYVLSDTIALHYIRKKR